MLPTTPHKFSVAMKLQQNFFSQDWCSATTKISSLMFSTYAIFWHLHTMAVYKRLLKSGTCLYLVTAILHKVVWL